MYVIVLVAHDFLHKKHTPAAWQNNSYKRHCGVVPGWNKGRGRLPRHAVVHALSCCCMGVNILACVVRLDEHWKTLSSVCKHLCTVMGPFGNLYTL